MDRNHVFFDFKKRGKKAFICFRSSIEGSSNQNLIKHYIKMTTGQLLLHKQKSADCVWYHQRWKRENHVLIFLLSPLSSCQQEKHIGSWAFFGLRTGEENLYTTGQHSPLSRGLREFTESRRPLPPRRGRACCSSFAVHRPFNPSPESPRNPKPSLIFRESSAVRLFWDHRRLEEWWK